MTSYTRHYDPNGINLDYAYWTSTDLFAAITRCRFDRITTQSANPQVQFVGTDDEGNVVQGCSSATTPVRRRHGPRLHPCWTDFRGNPGDTTPNQDSDTQAIRLVLGQPY